MTKVEVVCLQAPAEKILNYGKNHRIWPFFDQERRRLYVTVALARGTVKPVCKLLASDNCGQSFYEVADFYAEDKRNTTTGQPYVTSDGVLLVPLWNAGFYTQGITWFAIYRSEDEGHSWKSVYQDLRGTYGKHFFQSPFDESLYLGIGVGGGGFNNKVKFTPAQAYVVKSQDHGSSWGKILKVDYPTAIYSGAVLDEKTLIVAAREKKSVFRSPDGGATWKETYLGNVARVLSYFKKLGRLILSSNSSIFISDDGISWTRFNTPVKWLVLRYPTLCRDRIYIDGVGGRSIVLSTDLAKWSVAFDGTEAAGSNFYSRMAIGDDYIFLGNEVDGTMLRVRLDWNAVKPIPLHTILLTNMRSTVTVGRQIAESILARSMQ